jgi:Stress responsive A/B Barrel Domain
MLRHVVSFRFKEPTPLSEWIESSQFLATIPGVKNVAACPLLKQDLFHGTLYMEFENESDLLTYQEHPLHRKYVNEVLVRQTADRMAVDLLQA